MKVLRNKLYVLSLPMAKLVMSEDRISGRIRSKWEWKTLALVITLPKNSLVKA